MREELLIFPQGVDNLDISGGKGILIELIECHPAHFFGFDGLGNACKVLAVMDVEGDAKLAIDVVDNDQAIAYFYFNSQLFSDFSFYTFHDGFSRLDFAAGEFPKSAH